MGTVYETSKWVPLSSRKTAMAGDNWEHEPEVSRICLLDHDPVGSKNKENETTSAIND